MSSPIHKERENDNKQGFLFFTILKVDMKLRTEEEINDIYKALEQEFLVYLEKNISSDNNKALGARNSKIGSPNKRKLKNDDIRNLREEFDDHFLKLYEKVKAPCVELNPGKLMVAGPA